MARTKVAKRSDPPRAGELRARDVAKRLKCQHQNIYQGNLLKLLQPRIEYVPTYYFPVAAVEAVEAARAKAFAAGTRCVKGHWYEHLRREDDQIVADLPEAERVSSDLLTAPQQVPDSEGLQPTVIGKLAGRAPKQLVHVRADKQSRTQVALEKVRRVAATTADAALTPDRKARKASARKPAAGELDLFAEALRDALGDLDKVSLADACALTHGADMDAVQVGHALKRAGWNQVREDGVIKFERQR